MLFSAALKDAVLATDIQQVKVKLEFLLFLSFQNVSFPHVNLQLFLTHPVACRCRSPSYPAVLQFESGCSSSDGSTRSWCSLAGKHSWSWGHGRCPPPCSLQKHWAVLSAWSSTSSGRSGSESSAERRDTIERNKHIQMWKTVSKKIHHLSVLRRWKLVLICYSFSLSWLMDSFKFYKKFAAVTCKRFYLEQICSHFISFKVYNRIFN